MGSNPAWGGAIYIKGLDENLGPFLFICPDYAHVYLPTKQASAESTPFNLTTPILSCDLKVMSACFHS